MPLECVISYLLTKAIGMCHFKKLLNPDLQYNINFKRVGHLSVLPLFFRCLDSKIKFNHIYCFN